MEAFYQAVFWKILHILLYISLTKQYTACVFVGCGDSSDKNTSSDASAPMTFSRRPM